MHPVFGTILWEMLKIVYPPIPSSHYSMICDYYLMSIKINDYFNFKSLNAARNLFNRPARGISVSCKKYLGDDDAKHEVLILSVDLFGPEDLWVHTILPKPY